MDDVEFGSPARLVGCLGCRGSLNAAPARRLLSGARGGVAVIPPAATHCIVVLVLARAVLTVAAVGVGCCHLGSRCHVVVFAGVVLTVTPGVGDAAHHIGACLSPAGGGHVAIMFPFTI